MTTDDYVIVSVLTASNTKRKTDGCWRQQYVRFGAYQKLSKKCTTMKKEILGEIVPSVPNHRGNWSSSLFVNGIVLSVPISELLQGLSKIYKKCSKLCLEA